MAQYQNCDQPPLYPASNAIGINRPDVAAGMGALRRPPRDLADIQAEELLRAGHPLRDAEKKQAQNLPHRQGEPISTAERVILNGKPHYFIPEEEYLRLGARAAAPSAAQSAAAAELLSLEAEADRAQAKILEIQARARTILKEIAGGMAGVDS